MDLQGKDRLIVALDLPDHEAALEAVDVLDNVFFFKIGYHLLLTGRVLELLEKIQEDRAGQGGVFIDFKLPGDIDDTIKGFIRSCLSLNVKLLTLDAGTANSKTARAISIIQEARGESEDPRIIMVPMLSSLDADDLELFEGEHCGATRYIVDRGRKLLEYGCDGLVVSGEAIKTCRESFPNCMIVSPGIRPTGFPTQDHKRYTTPAEAIRYGADYLVVGRPVLQAKNRWQAAQDIISEIDRESTHSQFT
ncbi:MAG: orotidine-5'-phosphate decarboxylase [bacterium]|nr:orotidine-5'-phosphate decarboxylase [bacterium]